MEEENPISENISTKTESLDEEKQICGLVMPISTIDSCNEQHWKDVKQILIEVIKEAKFNPNLVSEADDVGVIQKRIVQNLYENPIVICDISCKNSNVMFELGLRLAFDKPTIIIKDDETSFSFDTAPIEHLEYPRDLRFNKIVVFREELLKKIQGTYKKSIEDVNYSPFLKTFGEFTVATLDTKEISKEDYIIEELQNIKNLVRRSRYRPKAPPKAINQSEMHPDSDCKNKIRRVVEDVIEELSSVSIHSAGTPEFRKQIINEVIRDKRLPECYEKTSAACLGAVDRVINEKFPTGIDDF